MVWENYVLALGCWGIWINSNVVLGGEGVRFGGASQEDGGLTPLVIMIRGKGVNSYG